MMSILTVYLFFIIIITAICIFVFPELISNIKELIVILPDLIAQYQKLFDGFVSSIRSSKWSDDIKSMIFKEIGNGAASVQEFLSSSLKYGLQMLLDAVTMFIDFTVALVIAYYFIKDADFFKRMFLSLFPAKWRHGLVTLGRDINCILSGFIQGQLLTAFIVGILETAGLMLIGAKYSLVLGLIGGLANIIPYFGPVIGAIPAVAVSLLESPLKALYTVIVFVVVQQLDNSFISPKVIEGKLGLHPVTTILMVLIGGEFFGLFGMLVAVPAAAIIKVAIKRSIDAIA